MPPIETQSEPETSVIETMPASISGRYGRIWIGGFLATIPREMADSYIHGRSTHLRSVVSKCRPTYGAVEPRP